MEEEDLLASALGFFGLEIHFSEEDFRHRYRELAKRYHPDSSEYSSPVLFNELTRSKTVLEKFLAEKEKAEISQKHSKTPTPPTDPDPAYQLYKQAKDVENAAVLEYFEKTKGNPIYLNPEDNPPLRDLQKRLTLPLANYRKILNEYPRSIWANDAQDSTKRLENWLGRMGG